MINDPAPVPITSKPAIRPPACPGCHGRGYRNLLCFFGFTLARARCDQCGGAGVVPAKYARIADPKARAGALRQYAAAARLN
jgi:hypothetical protein